MLENIVYGINSVKSVLIYQPHLVIEFFVQEGQSSKKQELIALAKKNNINVQSISKQKIDKWLGDYNHQGVVLKIKKTGSITDKEFFQSFNFENSKSVYLILDEIQDPHNFGAILRTANALGVAAVITTKDKSVGINATVRKVSCGATETTTIVKANNLSRFIENLKQKGVWVMGTYIGEGEHSQPITDIDYGGPIALVVGREGKGIRQLTAKSCDYLVNIPMVGTVESLNVSVATGICLFTILQNLKTV